MAQNQLGMIHGHACAARRLGDALLRSFGHTQVRLRLASASSGDTKSQLGLEAPSQQDVEIWPALVRALEPGGDGSSRIEVVVSRTSLDPIAKLYGVTDVAGWLRNSFEGVVQGVRVMRIVRVTVDTFLGEECLYHVTATE